MEQSCESLLLRAVEKCDKEQAQALIKAGADLNKASSNGWTALMLAVLRANLEIAELLLQNGADVNVVTASEENPARTALAVAVGNGRVDMVRLLLQYGCNRHFVGADGLTALERARKLSARPHRRQQIQEIVALLERQEQPDYQPVDLSRVVIPA